MLQSTPGKLADPLVSSKKIEGVAEAKTKSLWKTLYDYSRSEKSTGSIIDGHIISNFSVEEKIKR